MENAHSTKKFVINVAASSRPSSPSHKRMDQRSTATNITNEIEARKTTNRGKKRKIDGRKSMILLTRQALFDCIFTNTSIWIESTAFQS